MAPAMALWVFALALILGTADSFTADVKLNAADTTTNSAFSSDLAMAAPIGGSTYLVAGASREDSAAADAGASYVFAHSGTTWSQQVKLTASDAAAQDGFGTSVAADISFVTVSSPLNDDGGSLSGSAYVFKFDGAAWSQQAKLVAADAVGGDYFGQGTGISGTLAVYGAYGRTASTGVGYVFSRSASTWTQQAKIAATDAAIADEFGKDVAISGNYLVVGAAGKSDGATNHGAAYVFAYSGTTWSQQAKLIATDSAANMYFGKYVAIAGDYVVISKPSDAAAGANSGAVYVFLRSGTTWTQQAKVVAADAAASDEFGNGQISIWGAASGAGSNNYLAVGSKSSATGSTYVFVQDGTTWAQQNKLIPSDSSTTTFGTGTAGYTGTTVYVASADSEQNTQTGGIYMYSTSVAPSVAPSPAPTTAAAAAAAASASDSSNIYDFSSGIWVALFVIFAVIVVLVIVGIVLYVKGACKVAKGGVVGVGGGEMSSASQHPADSQTEENMSIEVVTDKSGKTRQ